MYHVCGVDACENKAEQAGALRKHKTRIIEIFVKVFQRESSD